MRKISFFIFCCFFSLVAVSKYATFECSNLDRYLKYLQKSKKGTLEKHPKCNAAAIKKAYKDKKNREKWIETIEGPYQEYFGHPSSIFRDCEECLSKAPFYRIPSKEERNSKKYVFVLSVDGGGVKGLIPAKILQYIEQQTGKKISDMFDIFVGTSTGGLIALFLNKPTETGKAAYTASELVQMYRELSSSIFSHPNYLRKLRGTKGVLTSKYSAKPYEQLLKRYFGNVSMGQSINPVLVTSIDIENQKSFVFSTIDAVKKRRKNFFMWEAGRATSAAPTYFKPYKLKTKKGALTLVDGGVGINNPSLLGIKLAKQLYPKAKIIFVSLSTQVFRSKTKFKSSGPFGGGAVSLTRKGTNIGALVENLLNIPAQNTEYLSKRLLEAEGSTYIRIEAKERIKDIEMDDSSVKALSELEKISNEIIKKDQKLKKMITLLSNPKVLLETS
jgi:patatin-like phospholipase/acyl hydrolase